MKHRLMLTTVGLAALMATSAMAQSGEKSGGPPSAGGGASSGATGNARPGGGDGAATKEMTPAPGSTTGAAPSKPDGDNQPGKSADAPEKKDKNGDKKTNKAAEQDKSPAKTGDKPSNRAAEKPDASKPANEKAAAGQPGDDKTGSKATERTGNQNATGGQQNTATKKVEITGEKRTRVTTVFTKYRSEAKTDINIQVNIGSTVPRSAKLYVIPQDVVIVVPEYRAYRYIIIGENVIIIDPSDYTIIDVIPLVA